MVTDNFANQSDGLQSPGSNAFTITPDDGSPDTAEVTRGLVLAVAGDVNCKLANMSTYVVIPSLAAGVIHGLRVQAVKATSTTATGLVGIT